MRGYDERMVDKTNKLLNLAKNIVWAVGGLNTVLTIIVGWFQNNESVLEFVLKVFPSSINMALHWIGENLRIMYLSVLVFFLLIILKLSVIIIKNRANSFGSYSALFRALHKKLSHEIRNQIIDIERASAMASPSHAVHALPIRN